MKDRDEHGSHPYMRLYTSDLCSSTTNVAQISALTRNNSSTIGAQANLNFPIATDLRSEEPPGTILSIHAGIIIINAGFFRTGRQHQVEIEHEVSEITPEREGR